jgi:hypothetical protein
MRTMYVSLFQLMTRYLGIKCTDVWKFEKNVIANVLYYKACDVEYLLTYE